MTTRERIMRIIGSVILFVLAYFLLTSCAPRATCPTYASAHKAKKQLIQEKKGGEMGVCSYREDITRKEKKFANKVWNSDFCYVKKKKWKR